MLTAINKETLKKAKEFLTSEKTLHLLTDDIYLGSDIDKWPEVLRKMLTDSAVPKARQEYELCISSLGAILWQVPPYSVFIFFKVFEALSHRR